MKKTLCILAAIPLFLAGCAELNPLPTREQIAVADCGPKPMKYQETMKAWLEATLKDPESARYRNFSEPVKDCIRQSVFEGGQLIFGWSMSVEMNAKNSYGGYNGYETYSFMIRDEKIVA